ncbi:MAG TPA: hypothetical protein VIQ30_19895 [Pseudonocardia sp.]|jgi:hypothetical protein
MKKIVIVSVTAAVTMLGVAGVAYADGSDRSSDQGKGGTNCTSDDTINQSNRGHQFIGGNLGAQDAQGNVLGLQSSRPAGVCPSVLNNNHL